MTNEQWYDWKALVSSCENEDTGSIQVHGKKRRAVIIAMHKLVLGFVDDENELESFLERDKCQVTRERKISNKRRSGYRQKALNSFIAFGAAEK